VRDFFPRIRALFCLAGVCGGLCGAFAAPPSGRLKVTHIAPVSPDTIAVTIAAGAIVYGDQVPYTKQPGDRVDREGHARWVFRKDRYFGSLVGEDETLIYTADRFVGDRLDGKWAGRVESYLIASRNDPSFSRPISPKAVFRKTKPTDLGRCGPRHPWQFECASESVVYLKLPTSLSAGKSYTVRFNGKRLAPTEFVWDQRVLRSEAVHISHIGFHPHDPAKVAFLSCWMGNGGPMSYGVGMPFAVFDRGTGRAVLKGKTVLSKGKDERNEDAYKSNFNGTDVYELDFSRLDVKGEYVVAVKGVGCSYPFKIHPSAWRDAFAVSARGFYHQRSGIELGPPYTTFRRPRPFHPRDGHRVFASTCPIMMSGNGINYTGADKDNFANLVKSKTDQAVPGAWGGYMDAGDWDRRIQHLVVSRYLLELGELHPGVFADLSLNIPESGDGLPDIVSEALFNLDCYRRMQTPDGGIRGGIESSAHPRVGEGSWQESLAVMAYAPGVWASHWYAGVAARAALWLRDDHVELSRTYEDSALRAMDFAEKHLPRLPRAAGKKANEVRDTRNMAAAELFRLTGDPRYNGIFLETTAFTKPGVELVVWQKHAQRDNAWVYVRTSHPEADQNVQSHCRQAIIAEADNRAAVSRRTGFRWIKYDWQPVTFGALAVPDGLSLVRAHALTGKPKYLKALVLGCQHAAGANPINICYTTGIGPKYPLHPLHIDSRVTDQLPPPGLTVFGPIDVARGKGQFGQRLANQVLFPAFEKWPTIEAFWDIFWYPAMCEFTVQGPMAPNAYVWGYLAAVPRPQTP
jgi:endoglucanase